MDSLNNEDDLGWFSSAQPNQETEGTMTDDIKPDKMLENQRTPMLQVEDFLNNSDSNHAIEDEYGYTFGVDSAQRKSSENASNTSSQQKDILMQDFEVSQFFYYRTFAVSKAHATTIHGMLPSLMTLATHCMFSSRFLQFSFIGSLWFL